MFHLFTLQVQDKLLQEPVSQIIFKKQKPYQRNISRRICNKKKLFFKKLDPYQMDPEDSSGDDMEGVRETRTTSMPITPATWKAPLPDQAQKKTIPIWVSQLFSVSQGVCQVTFIQMSAAPAGWAEAQNSVLPSTGVAAHAEPLACICSMSRTDVWISIGLDWSCVLVLNFSSFRSLTVLCISVTLHRLNWSLLLLRCMH